MERRPSIGRIDAVPNRRNAGRWICLVVSVWNLAAPVRADITVIDALSLPPAGSAPALRARGDYRFQAPSPRVVQEIIVQPASPTTEDTIVVYYPLRGCRGESVTATMTDNAIEILVVHAGTCLSTIQNAPISNPAGAGSPLYSQYVIGRLPVGNYTVRLYYQEQRSASRSFGLSQSLSVMPAR
jgi:hypothetical protein